MAAREGKLLQLATGEFLPEGRARRIAAVVAAFTTAFVCGLLARAGWEQVALEREFETTLVGDVPLWPWLGIMPAAFVGVAVRVLGKLEGILPRVLCLLALGAGFWLASRPEVLLDQPVMPAIVVLIVAAILGASIFVTLGGAAVLLTLAVGDPAGAIAIEMSSLASSPFLAAIPLFTLTGFLLTEGRTPERLLEVFRTCFGWIPGGTALVCAFLCTFFTVFTGGSGVTILALGGLLLPALTRAGYRERSSIGLLTASGSLGLLLPPALPLILYAIAAEQPVEDVFKGGILPGLLLLLLVSLWAVREGYVTKNVRRTPFVPREALRATGGAFFELLVPVVVLVTFLGGYATLVESAAISAAYALVLQLVIRRAIHPWRDLPRVLRQCTALLGGVLILLCVAKGLTNWMVFEDVPSRLLGWVQEAVDSRLVFLLCLNAFLLAVGCFLDIYSAIFVVVPLIQPLAREYDIDPIHLGVIFIANLELGYLTPPVGLNLFLASYRFEKPLLSIWRAALPQLAVRGAGVLILTYVPWLSLALL